MSSVQALPHDAVKQLFGSLAVDGVTVEDRDGWISDGPSLENGAALPQNTDHGFQLLPRHGERRAFYGCDALSGAGKTEVNRGCGDAVAEYSGSYHVTDVVHVVATVSQTADGETAANPADATGSAGTVGSRIAREHHSSVMPPRTP